VATLGIHPYSDKVFTLAYFVTTVNAIKCLSYPRANIINTFMAVNYAVVQLAAVATLCMLPYSVKLFKIVNFVITLIYTIKSLYHWIQANITNTFAPINYAKAK
jgi:hypothetical protein